MAPGYDIDSNHPTGAEAPWRLVITGVAGAGKTTIATAMAARLGLRFVEGDGLHPEANVAKMAGGHPLVDADRWPWLARIREELRRGDVVVTCSALTRRYRDMLRSAGGVRFVHLTLDPATARARMSARAGHFMGPAMAASQFAALERPGPDETDVAVIDSTAPIQAVVDAAVSALGGLRPGPSPVLADGAADRAITGDELAGHVRTLTGLVLERGARRVLLVPPDHTRLHSRAGAITAGLLAGLERAGCRVAVLPATGTHVPMTGADARLMFGEAVPGDRLLVHRWRQGVKEVGRISAEEVDAVSGGRYREEIPVHVDEQLLGGWDLVVSIGQVLPHEVIGMANFTKNLVIGLGGAPTIHRSHFLGAVCDMESIMGRPSSPVRDVVDAAYDRFVDPAVPVMWVLTVIEAEPEQLVTRGLFAGFGGSAASGGAAYRAAADLSGAVNVHRVPAPLTRVTCWLDPDEFRSTWVANKAVYRTRMAIADGGELVVVAPGVRRFGEDEQVDRLIRRHGYRGTPATLEAVATDPELADNLGAAAHLIHGSSEGRFRIVYCTDPDAGGLTRREVEAAGYEWRPLPGDADRLERDGDTTFIRNPALGLWSAAVVHGG